MFCYGDLLGTVQNASVFNDSKEFVDRPLVAEPGAVLEAFDNLTASQRRNTTFLRQFVDRWTKEAGSDLQNWAPSDWTER